MTFSNQIKMNDAISYWTDGALGIGSFAGPIGLRHLLWHTICVIDYDKTEAESRGEERLFVCTLDFTVLNTKTGRRSLNYRQPKGYRPPPSGMWHVWDILASNWRTLNPIGGNAEVKAVFPTSLVPGRHVSDERALSNNFTQDEILEYERSVYNRWHNATLHQMSGAALEAVMDEDIDLTNPQNAEEFLRLQVKKEIDSRIDENLNRKKMSDQDKFNRIDLQNVDERDMSAVVEASSPRIVSPSVIDVDQLVGKPEPGEA